MNNHHPYSPSSLERRWLCPYSVHEVEYPDKETPFALEGTLLHEAIIFVGKYNTLNDEQKTHVDKCREFLISLEDNNVIPSEKYELKISASYNNQELYNGTIDCLLHYGDRIAIIDWKFGYNEVSEPKNNLQLAAYAAAAMQTYGMDKCETLIFQPRISNKPKKYTYSNPEAIIKFIASIIDRCKGDNPQCNPGGKQCQYCKLKENLACPALKQELSTIDKIVDLPAISDTDLISLYERSKVVNKFTKAIDDEVKSRIQQKGYCGNKIFKETSGGCTLDNITKVYDRVQHVINKKDFLNICTVSDIALKELYCYNRYELKKKDAEDEYKTLLFELRIPKEKRKNIVDKEEI